MFCENCGRNYANVRYTQIINGEKNEIFLCDKCSKKLGVQNFNIPIDISSFFSDFLNEIENESIFPQMLQSNKIKCDRCDLNFDEFISTGKLECPECYTAFESKLDELLKNLHGANRHIGRLGKIEEIMTKENAIKEDDDENTDIQKLKQSLKKAIKEEHYEEAAKLRDEIKKLEGEK